MKNVKVCFYSPFAYSLFNPSTTVTHGGSEIDLFIVSTAIAQDPRFSVTFISGDFGQPKIEKYRNLTLYRSFRTDIRGWKRSLYAIFVALPRLFGALNKAKADIYVQEGIGFETGAIALFCILRRKKFIYRIASTVDCDGTATKHWPLMGRIFLFGLKHANSIISQYQEQASLLNKNYGLLSTCIPNILLQPEKDERRPTSQRKYVLWINRLVPMKNPEILIKIARMHPDELFIMVAPTDPNNQAYAQKIFKLAAAEKNIRLIPGLKRPQLNELYCEAKILVNTSDFEGYPNTFIEAGAYKVPVLTLNVNPDNIFTKNGFGFCAQGDVYALSKALTTWLELPEKRERAGQALFDYVDKVHTLKKNLPLYVELFIQNT